MNESDAQGEYDHGRREAEVMCFYAAFECVNDGRCTDCEGYYYSVFCYALRFLLLLYDILGLS